MNRLLSVKETMEKLSISERKVRQMIAQGQLPTVSIGARRLVPEDELDNWIRQRTSYLGRPPMVRGRRRA